MGQEALKGKTMTAGQALALVEAATEVYCTLEIRLDRSHLVKVDKDSVVANLAVLPEEAEVYAHEGRDGQVFVGALA